MKLTVVVSAYNQAAYLRDCIVSLTGGMTTTCVALGLTTGQTYRNFEIIIVDDGSTDNTWGECVALVQAAENQKLDIPIFALRLAKNGGTPRALNAAIDKARGVFVTVVHGDDMLEPWHLATLIDAAATGRFVYGDLRVYSRGQRGATWRLGSWDFEKAKTKNLASAAILFARTDWKRCNGYPEEMNRGREDWAMTLRLAAHGVQGHHVNGVDPSYLYRREGQGRAQQNHTPEWAARFAGQMQAAMPEVYGNG